MASPLEIDLDLDPLMVEIMSALVEIDRIERIAAGEDLTQDTENQIDDAHNLD